MPVSVAVFVFLYVLPELCHWLKKKRSRRLLLRKSYDLIIIGAGPAGSSAAFTAAKQGADVLLIDKKEKPGIPERCGGLLLSNDWPEFLDVNDFPSIYTLSRIQLYSPDGNSVCLNSRSLGTDFYSFDRSRFDAWLLEKAEHAGARVATNTMATGLVSNGNGCVQGIYCQNGNGVVKVEAPLTIGADGIEMRVGRWAKLQRSFPSNLTNPCCRMLVRDIPLEEDRIHMFFSREYCPEGYAWAFPRGNGVYNVGLGLNPTMVEMGNARRKLIQFLEDKFGTYTILHESNGGVVLDVPNHSCVKPGLLLAGDSATLINPLTGGGIHTALLAGHEAGKTAVRILGNGSLAEEALQDYNRFIKHNITKDHLLSKKIKKSIYAYSDNDLNHAVSMMRFFPARIPSLVFCLLLSNPSITMKNLFRGFFRNTTSRNR